MICKEVTRNIVRAAGCLGRVAVVALRIIRRDNKVQQLTAADIRREVRMYHLLQPAQDNKVGVNDDGGVEEDLDEVPGTRVLLACKLESKRPQGSAAFELHHLHRYEDVHEVNCASAQAVLCHVILKDLHGPSRILLIPFHWPSCQARTNNNHILIKMRGQQ